MDEYLENFPVLVRILTLTPPGTELRDYARDDGYDIAFTDSNWQQLNHEIEFFDGATGTLYAWVKIPSLPTSTSTTIYMYYDNSGATNQENPTGVWDSNYKMVQHLSETAGTHYDSTTNNNDGTPFGGVTQDVAGQLDGGDRFDGSNDYIDFGDDTSLSITNQITFEIWVKPDSNTPSEYQNLLARSYPSYGAASYVPYQFYILQTSGNIGFASTSSLVDSGIQLTLNWQHVAVTVDQSSSTVKFYLNGNEVAYGTGNFGTDFPGARTILAAFNEGKFFDGDIDEVRLSNTIRDGCWFKTSYENQNDPSTFVTAGTAEEIINFQQWITIEARNAITSALIAPGMIEVDGIPTTTNPEDFLLITGSTHELKALSPVTISGTRYSWTSWSDSGAQTHTYTVPDSGGETVTAYFTRQFYLTVNSQYDEPSGEGWYDEGDTASFSVSSPYDYPNGTRAICDGYTVDGGSLVSSTSDSITMDDDHTIDFQWTTYTLNRTITIDSNVYVDAKEVKVDGVEYDTPKTFSWVNTTEHTLEALTPLTFSTGGRHVWDHWVDSPTAPNPRTYITPDPDGPLTIMAFYKIQYFLTVNSAYDAPQGQGWYDLNSVVSFNVTSPVEVNGTRYTCIGYEGDASGTSTSGTITMDSPKTITFLWEVSDYYLSVNSEYGTTHGEGWYAPGDTPEFYVTPEFIEEDGVRHIFQGWTGDYIDGANPAGAKQILMDGPKNVTAVWRDRFFIEIISPYGSPKGSSWPFKGENFEVSVTSPDSGYVVTGFKLDGGSLQPGSKYMFVNVQAPHKIEFFWGVLTETTVYTLTLNTNPPNKGTIAVGVTVYDHGESLTTIPGIYTIQASPDD
ncbi:DUF2341 domain-containing protein, partial [[Eubacterium] cellulosolvens]